jgi:hypothetical protein
MPGPGIDRPIGPEFIRECITDPLKRWCVSTGRNQRWDLSIAQDVETRCGFTWRLAAVGATDAPR